MTQHCPPRERLATVLDGGLDPGELDPLREHLAACSACRAVLDSLSDPTAGFLAAMRKGADLRNASDIASLAAVVDRLKSDSNFSTTLAESNAATTQTATTFLGPPQRDGDLGSLDDYCIEALLGAGGMGVVFRAFDPQLMRTVAVKVLRPERAGDDCRRRLVREAQIAARFRHDHLVAVFAVVDAPDRLPYIVMEHISGPTLAELVRDRSAPTGNSALNQPNGGAGARWSRRPPLRQIVEWIAQIADGLHEAHRAGLIHRDIKPDNVLIDDNSGRAKLADFGLARPESDADRLTQDDRLAGTPFYMSPEQANGDRRLDARSDVYGLGATLYESLTGAAPFRGSARMVLEQIRSDEPKPPCRLNHAVDADLDTIVLCAMAKEPQRRYASAVALASDLRNWLESKPIAARPVGPIGKLARWSRRNPRMAALTYSVFGLLVLMLVGSTTFAVLLRGANRRAHRDRDAAIAASERADAAAATATANAERARASESKAMESAANAAAMLAYFQDKVLGAARPVDETGGLGKDVSLRRAVDAAEQNLTTSFAERPLVEAALRFTLGQSYRALGEPQLAIAQHRRSLALYKSQAGPNHFDIVNATNALAADLQAAGRMDEAVVLSREAVELATRHLQADDQPALSAMNGLGTAYLAAKRPDLAEPVLRRLLAAQGAKLDAGDARLIRTKTNLASAWFLMGRRAEALAAVEGLVPVCEKQFGTTAPLTLTALSLLGNCLMSERSKDAIAAFERVAKARHADLGAEHADTLVADNNLATAYVVARQYELAAPMFAKTLEVHRRRYGRDHPTTLAIEMNLGSTHLRRGRADLALPVLRRARDGYRKTFANEPLAYAGVLAGMGKELNRAQLHAEAEDWLRDCVVVRGKHAPNDWSLGYAQYLLGEAQAAQDKRRDALANLKSARALLEAQSSKVPSRYREALRNAARLLGDLEKRR